MVRQIYKSGKINGYLFILLVLCLVSCKDRRYEMDAGIVEVTQDGAKWDAEVTSLFDKRTPDVFAFRIFESVDVPDTEVTENLSFRKLPFETGKYNLKYDRDYYDEDVPQASLTHQILQGRERIDKSFPWETYPEQHFEITHVSNNRRNIEGNFKLAFISEAPELTQYYNLPDTTYLEGTFMINVRS